MKTFFGIDPGALGCIAIVTPEQKLLELLDLSISNEDAKQTKSQALRIQKNWERIASYLNEWVCMNGKPTSVLIEEPHSMPNQGVASTFTFGKNCGIVEGLMYGLQLKVFHTDPAVWKSKMGLNRVKQKSIDKAKELFADWTIAGGIEIFEKPKRLADGRAEAALLALMCAKNYGSVL